MRHPDTVVEVCPLLGGVAIGLLASGVGAVPGDGIGWAVFRSERLAWASILTAWGVCGLFLTVLSYYARRYPEIPPLADSVLIFQNFVLLAAAILMFRESRATMRLPVRPA